MTSEVVSANSAYEFTKFQSAEFQGNFISLLQRVPENCQSFDEQFMGRIGQNNLKSLANKDKMCGKTLAMVWTNSTHEFKLITLLPS